MEAHIREKVPEFSPEGLQQYLDSRDEVGTADATAKVNRIHKKLFDYVIGTLKEHYGLRKRTGGLKVSL